MMKRTAHLFASLLSAAVAFAAAASPAFAATTVTVSANKASWTYETPITVTLKASDAQAKIWYVFDPKAPPGDALPYEKPLRIEKSTPLLFFAYVDKENESKIERRDYVIQPVSLKIADGIEIANDAANVTVTLKNTGAYPVPLAGWTIRTDLSSRTFFAWAVSIPAGSSSDFTLPYSAWAVTLSSPDGEIRSTATVVRKEPVRAETVKTEEKPATSEKTVPVAETPKTVTAVDEKPKPSEKEKPASEASPAVSVEPAQSPSDSVKNPETAAGIPTTPEQVASAASSAESETASVPNESGASVKISAVEGGTSSAGKSVAISALGILLSWAAFRTYSILKNRRPQ